jgi:predicted Fe-Mo cluster-binding NifX family protein
MSVRIAVATTDGKVVNEHFGRADAFTIVELDETGHRFLEKRETEPVCDGGYHDDDTMQQAIDLLSDCRAVLVSRAGPGAKRALEIRNISVFEIGLPLDEALEKLRAYYYKNTIKR